MADGKKDEVRLVVGVAGEDREGVGEEEKLLEGMSAVDFETLCSTVAMQGHWRLLENNQGEGVGVGVGVGSDRFGAGVLRMWEGEVHDCFDDRRIAIETLCCPCYRFGKNLKHAGFGSSFVQGAAYLILALVSFVNLVAFIVSRRYRFLYLALALAISLGIYSGFLRTRMRRKFNIRGNGSYLDDFAYHLTCPCCSICQEARTLEMNNVQDGNWHGRGDTLFVESFNPHNKTFFALRPPSPMSMKSSSTQKSIVNITDPL